MTKYPEAMVDSSGMIDDVDGNETTDAANHGEWTFFPCHFDFITSEMQTLQRFNNFATNIAALEMQHILQVKNQWRIKTKHFLGHCFPLNKSLWSHQWCPGNQCISPNTIQWSTRRGYTICLGILSIEVECFTFLDTENDRSALALATGRYTMSTPEKSFRESSTLDVPQSS